MKVLHFYKSYFPNTIGGVEQVIAQISSATAKFGVESKVLTLSSERVDRTAEFRGHAVYYCRSNFEISSTPFSLSAFLRFSQLSEEADIIHYHFPYPFSDLLHFATRIKKPTVVTYHSDIIKQKFLLRLYKPLMTKFLENVDRIVATSPNYLESSETLSSFKDKVRVIPIGLDKGLYPEKNTDRLEFWKKRVGERFFLFVGVMRYYKGLHILIEAAINSEYPIVIVGSGPIENELKAQAARNKINNIHFVEPVSNEDKVALLMLSYAILFPSHLRSEAFGLSLLEGAMYQKPLISSEINTGTSYINIDGETGLVVPPGNSGALRQAMDYLWDHPQVARRMGESAGERYQNLFTADSMSEAYYDLYCSLLRG